MGQGSRPWPGGALLFVFLALGVVWAGLALLALFIGLVALYAFARPVSTLMLARTIEGKGYQRIYAPLRTIAPAALAAVIASEDATFCDNDGVDWGFAARGPERRGQTRPEPRRLDDHHADREEPVFVARPLRNPQGN